MTNTQANYFTFVRPVEIEGKGLFLSPNGFNLDSVERHYLDADNILYVVLKSQTEVDRPSTSKQGNKTVQVTKKQTVNNLISVPRWDDILRFFAMVGQVEAPEKPVEFVEIPQS